MFTKDELSKKITEAISEVKKTNPMAPSITNTVTINFVANAQLAVGGSAAMVYMPDEGVALAQGSKSLYINVGTIFPIYTETLPATAKACHECGNKWVLDPVAVGLGQIRTDLLKTFKEYKPQIIRANASETIGLAKMWGLDAGENKDAVVRGVDSTDEVQAALTAAKSLAKYTGGAVAVSGKVDLVTDGENVVYCNGGSNFMPMVTGMGCSLGGVCAVYASVTDPFTAALTATLVYNQAGTNAEKLSKGPGSFQKEFIDELYTTTMSFNIRDDALSCRA